MLLHVIALDRSSKFDFCKAFCGLIDTDGSIRIAIIDREKKRLNLAKKNSITNFLPLKIPFGFDISLTLTQSTSKNLFSFLEKEWQGFNSKDRSRIRKGSLNQETRWSVYLTSPEGRFYQKILEENLLHPARRNDFLIAKKLLEKLSQKRNRSKKELAALIYLSYQTVNQQSRNSIIKKKDINLLFNSLCLTETEKKEAIAEGKKLYMPIKAEVERLEKNLPSMILNHDYIVGAHWGDGSLSFWLPWKSEYTTKPVWTISDSSSAYLKAFQNTLKAGKVEVITSSFRFILTGIKNAKSIILPFFDNKPLPDYKAVQFQRFKEAVNLLSEKKHLTSEGGRRLLDCVYDISENSKRVLSKNDLKLLQEQWLKGKKV